MKVLYHQKFVSSKILYHQSFVPSKISGHYIVAPSLGLCFWEGITGWGLHGKA